MQELRFSFMKQNTDLSAVRLNKEQEAKNGKTITPNIESTNGKTTLSCFRARGKRLTDKPVIPNG